MKICIITGSSGALGQQVVSNLKKENYFIISIGRKENANADRNIICDLNNFNLSTVENELDQYIVSTAESLDFIHCAGSYHKEHDNLLENDKTLISDYNINTFSFYRIVQLLTKHWNTINSGSVVAISSNLTKIKNKNTAVYVSSKMALQGMVESFAETYGHLNVRFNTISPGMFPSSLNSYNVPDTFKANSPLGRICETQDISDLILFLISNKAACITAQNIIIDGGNSNGY